MRRLHPTANETLNIASALTALGTPPTKGGVVPSSWSSSAQGIVPEVDLDIIGSTAIAYTVGVLYAAKQSTLVVADIALTSVANATDIITKNAHGLLHGDGPLRFTTTGVLPAGIVAGTDYWIIGINANTFKVAASLALALAGTAVDFTDDGTGVHTLVDTASTKRLTWFAVDSLPTPIALTSSIGYSKRFSHKVGTVAYGLGGTLDTGNVTANIVPVFDR